jgi:putative ABC transport system permease protein
VVLAIAAIGMFAVMQLWVTAVLPELAVRRAVGARRRDVLRYVLARAIAVAVGGVALGLWLNEMGSGALAAAFAGLGSPSPGVVGRCATLLVLAALGGALLPAWHAARTPPAQSLAQLES